MNNFKIERMKIINFKLISKLDEPLDQIIILDGPNGFGKTTTFDAIELVLFGKIRRIDEYKVIDGKQGYRDSLFHKDPSKDVLVQIKFTSGDVKFVVTKRLMAREINSGSSKSNSPTEVWKYFETYITEEFVSDFSKLRKSKQKDVWSKLGVENLERIYHLFYYIQQEEKTFFLKRKETERLKELNNLFDTTKEEEEKAKIIGVRNLVKEKITKIANEIDNAQLKVDAAKHILKESDPIKTISYQKLLNGNDLIIPEWDMELTVVSEEIRNKFRKELESLKDFLIHYKDFNQATINKKLETRAKQRSILESTIILGNFIDSFSELETLFEKKKKYQTLLSLFQRAKFLHTCQNKILIRDLIDIIKQSSWGVDPERIKNFIDEVNEKNKNMSYVSVLAIRLNSTRQELIEKYGEFKNTQKNESGECPFCGHEWESFEVLLGSIQEKTEEISGYYDELTVTLETEIDNFFENFMNKVLDGIRDFLSVLDNTIDEEFYQQLKNHKRRERDVREFMTWCSQLNLEIRHDFNSEKTGVDKIQLEERVVALQQLLRSQKREIEREYDEESAKFKEFTIIYSSYFNGQEERVTLISPAMVDKKISYIDHIYYRTNEEIIKLTNEEMETKKEILNKYRELFNELGEIVMIYDNSIREHWTKIIREIELVFYIYCGKIIQYYQRGLGMFISSGKNSDTDESARAIRFVSGANTEHDAINYLSSGQISALVIAFTLALNRVYGNNGLDIILIDDPVQTMDDINMASLVELLRNDFGDKQIILSTHEDEVSRFIDYKFYRYGKESRRMRMKDLYLRSGNAE